MPKGKELTEFEKGQSNALFGEGVHKRNSAPSWPFFTCCKKFPCQRRRIWKEKNWGTQKKLTTRNKRRILREVGNSIKGVRKLLSELAPEVSHMTVWRTVKFSPNIVRQKMNKRPNLSDQHKANRVTSVELKVSFPLAWRKVSR